MWSFLDDRMASRELRLPSPLLSLAEPEKAHRQHAAVAADEGGGTAGDRFACSQTFAEDRQGLRPSILFEEQLAEPVYERGRQGVGIGRLSRSLDLDDPAQDSLALDDFTLLEKDRHQVVLQENAVRVIETVDGRLQGQSAAVGRLRLEEPLLATVKIPQVVVRRRQRWVVLSQGAALGVDQL